VHVNSATVDFIDCGAEFPPTSVIHFSSGVTLVVGGEASSVAFLLNNTERNVVTPFKSGAGV
jgi:hypothetical protein